MANWPNSIQCLGSDDLMSLGIKSFATEGVGTKNLSGDSRWVLHPQEGGRLDAERHYVILATALDGICPLGHACGGGVPQHSTAQA